VAQLSGVGHGCVQILPILQRVRADPADAAEGRRGGSAGVAMQRGGGAGHTGKRGGGSAEGGGTSGAGVTRAAAAEGENRRAWRSRMRW
jgi:hypothetical protein